MIDAMKSKRSFLKNLSKRFGEGYELVAPGSSERLRLSGKGLRVESRETPFIIEMGKQTLHLCPDRPADSRNRTPPYDYVLFDPELYYSGISQSLRLKPGESLSIDHRQEHHKVVFSKPKHAFRRHLQISHKGDALVFRDPISELGTYLSFFPDEDEGLRYELRRAGRLRQIREIYGGPLVQLEPDEALETLKAVNHLLKEDPYREKDSLGNAGSVVDLPAWITPVIVGDLHAQVDNLLKILTENAFLESIDQGDAALVLLGDAVHLEADEKLADMDSSVLIMDLILKLKLAYPKQVFFVMGNHDSFSPDVMKGGVPQSVLWEKRLAELRGKEYCEELAFFYRQSPLVVLSEDFIACHAGPPCSNVSIEKLIEARQFPELVHELTWNRIKTRGWPLGYRKGDVRRFRKSLGLDDSIPFIVAHYPQSRGGTLWLNVDGIPNHHILFSARSDRVALFTRVRGELTPQMYPSEPLLQAVSDAVE
jgi:hypothetical protein